MAESTAPVPQQERKSPLQLLLGIFLHPGLTLNRIAQRKNRLWWLPALITLVLVVTPVVAAGPINARESLATYQESQEQIQEQFGGGVEMTEEDMEQARAIVGSPVTHTILPAVGTFFGRIIGWLIWAGALYLGGMALGGRSKFGQIFSITLWCWMPYALRGVIRTLYILFTGQTIDAPGLSALVAVPQTGAEAMGAMGTIGASPGQQILTDLLGRLDIFMIWHLILLVFGVRAATQLPQRKAVVATIGVWVILTLLSLLPTIVGSLVTAGMSM